MSANVKLLTGTAAANDLLSLKDGAISVDVENRELRIHNGVDFGGHTIPGKGRYDAIKGVIDRKEVALTPALSEALAEKIGYNQLDSAGGAVSLDLDGKIEEQFLPTFVNDVVEFELRELFPSEGESSKLYLDKNTSRVYRWTGSRYFLLNTPVESSDVVDEGLENRYFTEDRQREAVAVEGDLVLDPVTGVFFFGTPVKTVNGKTGNEMGEVTLDKDDLGLGNVENLPVADFETASLLTSNEHLLTPLAAKGALSGAGITYSTDQLLWVADQGVLIPPDAVFTEEGYVMELEEGGFLIFD